MIGIEDALNSFSGTVIDRIMKAIWAAAMWLLRTAFELMDSMGGFRDGSGLVDATGRPSPAAPFFALWPTLLWIGGAVATGLFLWQLTLTMIRGGAGFWRVASGPAAYGVATALTLGVVAALVGASEGLTVLVLQRGLAAGNFRTILDHPNLAFTDNPPMDSSIDATARAVLLGMIALVGLLPAAIGFLLQMIFRQAVIIVLIATVPVTAAGLLANTTAPWFWRCMRWMLAAILMKPALALVLVVGVNMLSGPTGVGGLMAGAGVLLVSLFCPLVLFRLLAFVDVGNRSDTAARPALATSGGSSVGVLADAHAEQVNTARFDEAVHAGASRGGGAAGGQQGGDRSGRDGPLAAGAGRTGDIAGATMDATGIGHDRGRAGSGRVEPPAATTEAPIGRPLGRRSTDSARGAAGRRGSVQGEAARKESALRAAGGGGPSDPVARGTAGEDEPRPAGRGVDSDRSRRVAGTEGSRR